MSGTAGHQTQRLWTDDEIATLRRMHAEGKSASVIGRVVGRPKNSVISKIHHLGIQRSGDGRGMPGQPKPATVAKAKTRAVDPGQFRQLHGGSPGFDPNSAEAKAIAKRESDPIWHPIHGTTPVPLVDHREGQCRWVVGPVLYCGQPCAEDRKDFCPTHHRVAYPLPAQAGSR